jgi:hypothetical protein
VRRFSKFRTDEVIPASTAKENNTAAELLPPFHHYCQPREPLTPVPPIIGQSEDLVVAIVV